MAFVFSMLSTSMLLVSFVFTYSANIIQEMSCSSTRDGHGIPKCCPCPSVVFLMLPGPSVHFRVFFLGGKYVCPSYGQLKFLKSARSGRKSVRPFVNKLRNPFLPKNVKKCLKYKRCDITCAALQT